MLCKNDSLYLFDGVGLVINESHKIGADQTFICRSNPIRSYGIEYQLLYLTMSSKVCSTPI